MIFFFFCNKFFELKASHKYFANFFDSSSKVICSIFEQLNYYVFLLDYYETFVNYMYNVCFYFDKSDSNNRLVFYRDILIQSLVSRNFGSDYVFFFFIIIIFMVTLG